MRAAGLPDDLEMILEEHRLGVSAALFLSCRISIQMKPFFFVFADFCAGASGSSHSW
jgi:hypothetical protein